MTLNDKKPWMTIVIIVAALIVLGVGGVSVITGDLAYKDYLDNVTDFGKAVGLVAIGRGILGGLAKVKS